MASGSTESGIVAGTGSPSLRGLDAVRVGAASLVLQLLPVGREMDAFARWFEGCRSRPEGPPELLRADPPAPSGDDRTGGDAADPWRRLRRFLRGIGVGQLALDPRLESNQVRDVLVVLYAFRGAIRSGGRGGTGAVAAMLSGDGLAHACALVRLHRGRVVVAYSYCMTRFSLAVKWFKRRHTALRDHRALFRAAPRFAALVALGPAAVLVVALVQDSGLLLVASGVVGSVALGAATYLFFMTVGSVEYDNEEKARSLRAAHDELKRYADRMRADMDRARDVQQRMLPDQASMPAGGLVEWAAFFEPEDEVGGDYFDAVGLPDGRVATLFADVSGHGLGAALVTAILKTTFQAWLERGSDLEDLVRLLNRRLLELTPVRSFAAVVVGILDPVGHVFSYSSCGHNPLPYLVRSEDAVVVELDRGCTMVLGVWGEVEPSVATVALAPGDVVFLATDGITESRASTGEEFGAARLEQQLGRHHRLGLAALVAEVARSAGAFAQGGDHHDDRTILAFRLLGPPPPAGRRARCEERAAPHLHEARPGTTS